MQIKGKAQKEQNALIQYDVLLVVILISLLLVLVVLIL